MAVAIVITFDAQTGSAGFAPPQDWGAVRVFCRPPPHFHKDRVHAFAESREDMVRQWGAVCRDTKAIRERLQRNEEFHVRRCVSNVGRLTHQSNTPAADTVLLQFNVDGTV